MQALCSTFTSLRVSVPKAPKPFIAAKSLSSKTNGISGAAKLVTLQRQHAEKPVAAMGLDVQCADGRRGGKLKTRKSAAKRFQVTGSGRIVVRHAGKNHFQEKKSSKRKQKLTMKQQASDSMLNNIKGCLPYARIGK